jgi:hypothetical protein
MMAGKSVPGRHGRGAFPLRAILPNRDETAAMTPLGLALTNLKNGLGRPRQG